MRTVMTYALGARSFWNIAAVGVLAAVAAYRGADASTSSLGRADTAENSLGPTDRAQQHIFAGASAREGAQLQ